MRCAMFNCNSDNKFKKFDKTVRFFRFPANATYMKVWLNACKRSDTINVKTARLCSKHFVQTDYKRNLKAALLGYAPTKCRLLKEDAVPTLNLPANKSATITNPKIKCRAERAEKRSKARIVNELIKLHVAPSDSNKIKMALRWGIASSGFIANDFVTALKGLSRDEHQVVAIAARSLESAEKFAKTHDIPKAYQGYDSLAKDTNVQVVYIGVLNPQHYEVATLMLENGKHVLCEKPFTLNEKSTRKVIDLAKSKNLFIMEAVWSRFLPVYQEVRQLLNSGAIGEVRFVSVGFGVPIDQVDRVKLKDLGGGAILDIGVYPLQFQQFVYKDLKPEKLVIAGHLNEEGVDDVASAIFTYPGNKTAIVTCNATVELPNEAYIVGTKGTIKIPTCWAPISYKINDQLKELPFIKNDGKFNYHNSAGLAYQAIEVRKRILAGQIESETMPHAETIQLAAWMDAVRKELGVVFAADSQ